MAESLLASVAQLCDQITGPAKATRVATASTIFPRLRMKRVTFTILPPNQKLTKNMTKWDSAHKFGQASTVQDKIRCHNDDVQFV